MKRLKTLTIAAMLGLFTAGAAMAQNYGPPPGPPPGPPGPPGYGHPGPGPGYGPGPAWHRWHRGERFYGPRVYVPDWAYYHLAPPPYGYRWVRYPHQYVLIGINSGIVAQVIVR
jgi:hypothetical protein